MYADHFSLNNLPFGIASSTAHPTRCVVTRLRNTVIFLDGLQGVVSLSKDLIATLRLPTVNKLAARPKYEHKLLREILIDVLGKKTPPELHTEDVSSVQMHLPVDAAGFTDFSCSMEHCLNAGEAIMKKRVLPPGFLHFPIGYTGRTSSLVVSGTPITRPNGHFKQKEEVVDGPTRQMDYELEVAAIIGKSSTLGEPISINDADDHIFGLVLINDWSARDIQGLEMSPLGPMNGKSFATTMSPWIVTLFALEPAEIPARPKDLPVSSYLRDNKQANTYDIKLEAELVTNESTTTICRSELKWMYWTVRDLVAHQTSNGCNLNTGDILATGTISGTVETSHGCLLELTKGGENDFALSDGDSRTYLQDGDMIRLTAHVSEGVGFGDCCGTLLPAIQRQKKL
ncbi:FAH [Glarea lozoyensis ATCC 20868]|uniref:Fumarylacetoacetase n=1 Tax=Glarea lozoyensis (strain ATCC 20868 / MF5171) TaxID=1116229 RepID=S3E963_GLAL2|nr:FAH [Glarea lozoyensis ATCC 20868]EPE34793.1 FAH [Glarea lozoyensis ATCC 20868]